MKTTIHDFCHIMSTSHGFTYEGAKILYKYLEGIYDDENEYDFDPVALRCEYNEYTLSEYNEEYPECKDNFLEMLDDEEFEEEELFNYIERKDEYVIGIDANIDIILVNAH